MKEVNPAKIRRYYSIRGLSVCLIHVFLTICANAAELNECTDIENSQQRLDCFDRISREKPENKAKPAAVKDVDQKYAETSLLDLKNRWKIFAERETFKLTPHNANYFLPVAYTGSPNTEPWQAIDPGFSLNKNEVKFQLSGKIKISNNLINDNADLWFGYTQKVFWQLYNADSSPFRETNYKPEVWLSFITNYTFLGLTGRFIDIGIVHESNGRSRPLSRSWNRLYLLFGLEHEDFGLTFQPWYRFKEDAKNDDNPDIEDFIGRAEFTAYYHFKNQILLGVFRTNFKPDTSGGSIELNWAFPIYKGVRGVVQYFNGYGESLLDYNVKMERIGLGVVLTEWI